MQEQTAKPRKKKKRRMRLPNGLGSVHLIGDSKSRRKPWRARVPSHVELDEISGTAKQKYITIGYFETEIEAIDALMEYRKNPFTLDAATCTFEEVYERWKAKKYKDISESGQRGYDAAYKHSHALYNMKMRDIRTSHMDGVMETVPGKYQTQVKVKSLWIQMFKYAMENDIAQKNYAEFVKLRDKQEDTKRTDIPKEQREKIWKLALNGDLSAQIALIYIYTGMRPSELLLVEKENVDIEARILVGGLKTDAGKDRRVPLHKCILPFVERLMEETPGKYLIPGNKGKALTLPTYCNRHWNPLTEQLGVTQYTPHYTRHTCATMLREAKVADDLRKVILGHKNSDITDRYTHFSDAMLLEAIDALPDR